MIRQPTSAAKLMAWHRDALAGRKPPIHDGDPQSGWFRVRVVKRGPFLPARIWITREIEAQTGELAGPEEFNCQVNGQRRDAYQEWTWLSKNPISKADFDALAELHSEQAFMQATHVAIDLSREVIRP